MTMRTQSSSIVDYRCLLEICSSCWSGASFTGSLNRSIAEMGDYYDVNLMLVEGITKQQDELFWIFQQESVLRASRCLRNQGRDALVTLEIERAQNRLIPALCATYFRGLT